MEEAKEYEVMTNEEYRKELRNIFLLPLQEKKKKEWNRRKHR